MSTLEAARTAKEQLLQIVGDSVDVNAIGISNDGSDYYLKVNVTKESAKAAIPDRVGDVLVKKEVVGAIKAGALEGRVDLQSPFDTTLSTVPHCWASHRTESGGHS